jgi:hypothetical protein
MIIRLRDNTQNEDPWGHEEGRQVFIKLLSIIEANPSNLVFSISLENIRRTDASFPRESVLELAKRYRGSRGFCLVDVLNPDLIENWDAAAIKLNQPLMVWQGEDYKIIGPKPNEGSYKMLEYVLSKASTTTSEAAKAMEITTQNASNKLKYLYEGGYVFRKETVAQTGGIEFEYFRIK